MNGRTRRYAGATLSMIAGTSVTFGVVIGMNESSRAPDRPEHARSTRLQIEPPVEEPPEVDEPEPPPPRPPDTALEPPPPLASLDSEIGGVKLSMPGFDTSALDAVGSVDRSADRDMVMTSDTVDQRPKPVRQGRATYPPQAKRDGVEGYVKVSILIDAGGRVQKVRVLESSPEGVFDEAAVDAVRAWQFEPARYEGQPVKVWARQTIRFDLS